jgi:hypothetical protein
MTTTILAVLLVVWRQLPVAVAAVADNLVRCDCDSHLHEIVGGHDHLIVGFVSVYFWHDWND